MGREFEELTNKKSGGVLQSVKRLFHRKESHD